MAQPAWGRSQSERRRNGWGAVGASPGYWTSPARVVPIAMFQMPLFSLEPAGSTMSFVAGTTSTGTPAALAGRSGSVCLDLRIRVIGVGVVATVGSVGIGH